MVTPPLDLCRGRADHGIGAPDLPGGGQYLAADPPLAADPALLHAVRHWLTLDAAPGDPGRAGGSLTGWACFPAGPWTLVARLTTTRRPDGRDDLSNHAWFAHARVWPRDADTADFDPGGCLGDDRAFLAAPPVVVEPRSTPGFDGAGRAAETADTALAVSLIAHLFQGLLDGLPVILAVPLSAFAVGTPLAATIALARGCLPRRLRRRCRLRVFTRDPARFLVPGGGAENDSRCSTWPTLEVGPADLLVIPEDLAATALAAVRRRALLLDARGERQDGPAPAPGLFDYARAAVASARRLPAHLARFGARFDTLWGDPRRPPDPDLTDWTALTYYLAAALAEGADGCGQLLNGYLLPQARAHPHLPWARLIAPADWADFPREPLIRLLLRADEDLSPGEQALQRALEDAFRHLGARVDAGLAAWWNPADPARVRRLLALADGTPPLVSAPACAGLTAGLPIGVLADSGGPLAGALRAELATGVIGRRRGGAAGLLTALERPGVGEVLSAAGLAAPLLEADDRAGRLGCAELLRLGSALPADADAALAAWARRLDTLMDQDPAGTTAQLIRHGAWLPWRRRAESGLEPQLGPRMEPRPEPQPEPGQRHRLAMTWLTSPALAALRGAGARTRPPQWQPPDTAARDDRAPIPAPPVDVTRETWDQVMSDLGPLEPAEARTLCEPPTHWPWLHPHQADQLRDLTARCRDPASAALFTAAAMADETGPAPDLAAAASGPWTTESVAAPAGTTPDRPGPGPHPR